MRKATLRYNIPYTSFREHLYRLYNSRVRGIRDVLTHNEERELVDYCIAMFERRHGLIPLGLKMKVTGITKNRNTPFRNKISGNGWMISGNGMDITRISHWMSCTRQRMQY